ncbi:cytoplasmic polyadenylation element-binding protein 3-like protein, partial [Leptotrombidium deliense]
MPRKISSPANDQYSSQTQLYFQSPSPANGNQASSDSQTSVCSVSEESSDKNQSNASQTASKSQVSLSATSSSQQQIQPQSSQDMRSIHTANGCLSEVNVQVDDYAKPRKAIAKNEECGTDKQIGDLSECSSNGSLVSASMTTGNCVQITQTQQNQAQLTASHQLNVDQASVVNSCISSGPSSSYWSSTSPSESEPPFFQAVTVASMVNGGLSFHNYSNSSSIQMNIPQQHSAASTSQRRAITGAHNFPQTTASLRQQQTPQQASAVQSSSLFKSYSTSAWNNPQSTTTWSSSGSQQAQNINPWSTLNVSSQKRSVGGVVPNLTPISPMKKSPPTIGQSSMMISPSKFRRSTSMPLGKPFPSNIGHGNGAFEMSSIANDSQTSDTSSIRDSNVILPFQDRTLGNIGTGTNNPLDTLRFPLEQQLLEIMRSASGDNQDHYK